MNRLSTIELFREDLSFSAGHFIIFSATERSRLHGHNFQVHAAITTHVLENGLTFDYRHYKEMIRALCRSVNGIFLIPGQSQYLQLEEQGDSCTVHFNQEKIPFLKRDILILPVSNITVEELSTWFLNHLIADRAMLDQHLIQMIKVKISSAAGVFGSAHWERA